MRNTYEFVDHDERLPVKVFLHDVARTPRHWHEDVEILFVLRGSIRVVLGAEEVLVPERGLCVVNSHQVHDTEGLEDNITLALQLDPDFIEERSPGFKRLRFAIRPFEGRLPAGPDELRRAIAELMSAVSRKGKGYLALAHQWLFRVAFLLETACVDPDMKASLVDAEDGRLRRIISFIEERSTEEIKLGDLAAFANLNPQYLSRYFSTNMGVTLSRYIASIRARNALALLETGGKPVTEIALECGFPNLKAFYAAFKENFGRTPKKYLAGAMRQDAREAGGREGGGPAAARSFDYLSLDMDASLSLLYEYLGPRQSLPEPAGLESRDIRIEASARRGPFPAAPLRIASFGRAAEGLRAGFRSQLSALQREIGFDCVRFHGIFSDEMMVARRRADGGLAFDFTLVDELLDFLLSLGLRPFLELGFMPRALAREDRGLFDWGANLSPPADPAEWRDLVAAFIGHAGERYGKAELARWHFEVWNEPELEGIFWHGNRREFFEFYAATRAALKSYEASLRVGGCGFTHWVILGNDWLDDFEAFCVESDAMPDFVSFHVYPVDMPCGTSADLVAVVADWNKVRDPRTLRDRVRMGGPGAVETLLEQVGARLDRGPLSALPRFVTEWNSSPNSRDLVHDTAFMGAFVARNLSACLGRPGGRAAGRCEGMAYWVFTDIFEEFGPGEGEFHGGFGLCTRHGLRKASWQAYRLFAALRGEGGATLLGSGEGWLATLASDRKDDPVVRILLHNYRHYDAAYSHFDASLMKPLSRYEVFERGEDLECRVEVAGLVGSYEILVSRVG
ncbi:MAG: helix-turn-helix domain-containing protein, partial [Spirochaetaceae bacterium]|nr:helix-turn-helix domain-containing protein [Spirochaetaceae bacterium]